MPESLGKFDMFLHAHLTLDESIKFINGCKYKTVTKYLAKALDEWLTFQRLGSVTYEDGHFLITLPWEGAHHISIWLVRGKKTVEILVEQLTICREKCTLGINRFRDEELTN